MNDDMTLALVQCDDWTALVINGEVVYANHSMSAAQLLDELESRKGFLEEWSVRRLYIEDDEEAKRIMPGPDLGELHPELEAKLHG